MNRAPGAPGALLGVWCAVAVACSGSPPRMAAAPAARSEPGGDLQREPRAEIDALDRQIADALARAGIAPPRIAACTGAACAQAMSTPFATPAQSDPACHPAATERCKDACTISASICSNQQRICDLARQLAGDDWAADRCARAQASCQAAHDSCCRCVI